MQPRPYCSPAQRKLIFETPALYTNMMSAVVKLSTRPLGKNGPLVPRIGLGLMGLSGAHGVPKSDTERLGLLNKAYEMGETFWDTGKSFR